MVVTDSSVICVKIFGLSPEFSSQPGPAELWFHLPGGQENSFLFTWIFIFKRGLAPLLEMEREGFSLCLGLMRSALNQTLKDLLYWRSILISVIFVLGFLSNVTLVKTFSNLSRDYFRWIMISVNHISFHCFGNNYLSCIFYRYLWVMAPWGAGSRGLPWLHAITSGQVTEPSKSQFPYL